MSQKQQYIYGPVPSRRLGLSLGLDLVPYKTCSLDCIYCQLGATTNKTIQRKEYVPIKAIVTQLKQKIKDGLEADYITLGGSGEPTLNSKLGLLIREIRKITDIPVAILTNGTLLSDKSVRDDCALADLVIPSLDAADEETFRKINRPHSDISIENFISSLVTFRKEFSGKIWLEVFLLEGINTVPRQIEKMKKAIERIMPDKIQLNTAVRPTAEPYAKIVTRQKLTEIAGRLGPKCEAIAYAFDENKSKQNETKSKIAPRKAEITKSLLSMLKRRPCSINDISSVMKIHPNEVIKYINYLRVQSLILAVRKNKIIFYKAK